MSARDCWTDLPSLLGALDGMARIDADGIEVLDEGALRERAIDDLIVNAVFADEPVRAAARWIIRAAAVQLGAFPASIDALYRAAGRGEYAHATAPAINVRGLAYDTMRAIFRAAQTNDCKIVIFELARSEMGYTQQRPGEYASNALAAAIREGHRGPVFIQGDHYQVSVKNYAQDPEAELAALRELTAESIAAGYFNIDIDASTMVDIELPTLEAQQELNARLTADLTRFIRVIQPEGVNVSVGGEIGEVGHRNSTVPELRAFMDQYLAALERQANDLGRGIEGISKISVQTGTSHGGVVLPDGSIKEVAVDFETLAELSRVAREAYGMGGAVQHGASTLPDQFFHRFAEANAIEVHLATGFQNVIFDSEAFPAALRDEIYAYLAANHASERKPGQTDAQFYYTARKRAWGPFKQQVWGIEPERRATLAAELEEKFGLVMRELGVAGSAALVDRIVTPYAVPLEVPDTLLAVLRGESVAASGVRETYEHVEGE
ncbi:MAG: class II fructose-bisphosphate aldolase [Thermomicrobiales bacterium]|nr:class II fructose-bisphosphate aldolase [Thermomicrobiales bacterium]